MTTLEQVKRELFTHDLQALEVQLESEPIDLAMYFQGPDSRLDRTAKQLRERAIICDHLLSKGFQSKMDVIKLDPKLSHDYKDQLIAQTRQNVFDEVTKLLDASFSQLKKYDEIIYSDIYPTPPPKPELTNEEKVVDLLAKMERRLQVNDISDDLVSKFNRTSPGDLVNVIKKHMIEAFTNNDDIRAEGTLKAARVALGRHSSTRRHLKGIENLYLENTTTVDPEHEKRVAILNREKLSISALTHKYLRPAALKMINMGGPRLTHIVG